MISQDDVHNCFVFLAAIWRWPLFTDRSAQSSPDLDTPPGQVRTPLTPASPDLQPLEAGPGSAHWAVHSMITRGDHK